MGIHSSARRHGVNGLDIQGAVEYSLAVEDIGEDPDRWLVIGPDRARNLLDLVDQRDEIVVTQRRYGPSTGSSSIHDHEPNPHRFRD